MRPSDYARYLRRYLRPQGWRVAALAALMLGGLALQLVNPQIIRYFLDTVQSRGQELALLLAAGSYLAVALLQQLIHMGATYAGERVAWEGTNRLRHDLALHLLRLDLPFHKTHLPGELIERVDGDASMLANFLSQFSVHLTGSGLLALGILALLYTIDWRVGLGLTVYVALTVWILARVQNVAAGRWQRARQSESELHGFMEERLAGAEDIRALGGIPYQVYRLLVLLRGWRLANRSAFVFGGLIFNVTNLLAAAGYAIGLGLAAWLYSQGSATIGTAFLIVAYVGMLSTPLQRLRQEARNLQQAGGALVRIDELFRLQPRVTDPPAPAGLPSGALAVELREVGFSYDGDDPVLHDISFSLAPGKVLGVLGRTGSGKTTLTRLLFRLYDPSQGTVQLGGVDLRQTALADLRTRVGMVTQDVQLFQASLGENLAFFDPSWAAADLQAALDAAQLTERVLALPGGLEAPLASGGQGLSAGEAQLLAFSRVFLKDPGLVILDEASSRLDPATERRMETAIDLLLAGRTGIIIAHRLQTVQRADDILILEDGRVVEYGPRISLAADPQSRFYHLLQTGLEAALA